ncbi:hypothetical protein MMC26_006474 [Xylographa opegraphella]|nr:hypothetical protein [Xylographa opegraphella]
MASKRSRQIYEADLPAHESPYVVYGTPLPPADQDVRDDGSYVPIWKQEVTDDRGRKRLHGAFTGGFSAGYFNTVGSKEGWTPSAFVSSKSSKKKGVATVQQKLEDFMDEEDIADTEESKNLETSDSFVGLGSTEGDLTRQSTFMDILKVSGETMGVRLLRRMGWRDGQGIGPKVRRGAKLADGEEIGLPEGEEMHLFAPEDSYMVSFGWKNDRKGLGYQAEERLINNTIDTGNGDLDTAADEYHITEISKSMRRTEAPRGGFGMGILNDNGSDEEDPYHMGPQISYNRVVRSDKKKKRNAENRKHLVTASNPLLRSKPVFISKKTLNSKARDRLRRGHDGRLPLEGFVLSSKGAPKFENVSILPTPEVPKDWRSSKTPRSAAQLTRETSLTYQSFANLARSSALNPAARANILGEAPLPGKSVFDYLTPTARARLAIATQNPNLPAALNEPPPSDYKAPQSQRNLGLGSIIPSLDTTIAATALDRGIGGWLPYAEDAAKRTRYRSFLEVHAGLREGLPSRAEGMSTDDWVNEMREFTHAAQIFKPMSGRMAERFTSGTSTTTDSGATSSAPQTDKETLPYTSAPKPIDPAEEAARVGMYGPLTRSSMQFFPMRLLCKRFNVKPPDHVLTEPGGMPPAGSNPVGASAGAGSGFGGRFQSSGYQTSTKSLELVGKKEMEELRRENGQPFGGTEAHGGGTMSVVEPTVVNPERIEALEKKRPGQAVFKAIFGSDSESDD